MTASKMSTSIVISTADRRIFLNGVATCYVLPLLSFPVGSIAQGDSSREPLIRYLASQFSARRIEDQRAATERERETEAYYQNLLRKQKDMYNARFAEAQEGYTKTLNSILARSDPGAPAADLREARNIVETSTPQVLSALTKIVESETFNIYFPFGSYVVTPEAEAVLQDAGVASSKVHARQNIIFGYSDSSEESADLPTEPLQLAERRAKNTADTMVSLGISPSNIDVSWKVVAAGRGINNRRVTLSIVV